MAKLEFEGMNDVPQDFSKTPTIAQTACLMDLVSQQYWDDSYHDYKYQIAQDELTKWISKQHAHFSVAANLFEFGCYPGRYLSYLGKLGWRVNGIDLTPSIETGFTHWLQSEGIKTGLITQADALKYANTTDDRYDLVCSFGFIEHFNNFLHVLELHDKILEKGGWLMISTPNFRGAVQKYLHQQFNKESLGIHYLPSMQPELWKTRLEELGYRVVTAEYFGGFDFWYDEADRSNAQNMALKIIRKVKPALKNLPPSSLYSPYCGLLAQKL